MSPQSVDPARSAVVAQPQLGIPWLDAAGGRATAAARAGAGTRRAARAAAGRAAQAACACASCRTVHEVVRPDVQDLEGLGFEQRNLSSQSSDVHLFTPSAQPSSESLAARCRRRTLAHASRSIRPAVPQNGALWSESSVLARASRKQDACDDDAVASKIFRSDVDHDGNDLADHVSPGRAHERSFAISEIQ